MRIAANSRIVKWVQFSMRVRDWKLANITFIMMISSRFFRPNWNWTDHMCAKKRNLGLMVGFGDRVRYCSNPQRACKIMDAEKNYLLVRVSPTSCSYVHSTRKVHRLSLKLVPSVAHIFKRGRNSKKCWRGWSFLLNKFWYIVQLPHPKRPCHVYNQNYILAFSSYCIKFTDQ